MSEPVLLKGRTPVVDPAKIGISYSGGGPLVLVELGVASAFVDLGIVPDVITGVSAGALAGTAHALDVRTGRGIAMAARLLERVSNAALGLRPFPFLWRLLRQRERIRSLGDNAPIGPLIRDGLRDTLGLTGVTVGTFAGPQYPELLLAATDVIAGTSVWFPADTLIEEALIASSALPGFFPWRTLRVAGHERTLVDGGVITNQPLSNLVERGCGTIYACTVGPTGPLPPPTNGLDNGLHSVNWMMHQCMKLEEEYVRLKIADQGRVIHIHPEVTVPVHEFDFTPEIIRRVMADARAKTIAWLSQPRAE